MIKKKYLLLGGLLAMLAAGPAFAQEGGNTTGGTGTSTGGGTFGTRDMTYRGESYDVMDTSYVPGRRMDQHRKFLNHQTNFPSKPRNMVEIGVSFGLYNVSGDVPSLMLWDKGGYGIGAHIRKALGYVGSVRLDYNYGIGKGLEFQPSTGYLKDPAWNGHIGQGFTGPYSPGADYGGAPIFYNYKTESHQLNLDVVISLGNILFHHTRTRVDPYIFGGVAGNAYQTWINALNSNFQKYDFNTNIITKLGGQNGFEHADRKDVKKELQSYLDDSYETNAETDRQIRRPTLFSTKKLTFAATFGAGLQYRISRRVNLSLEDRVTFFPTTNEDYMDGQHWDENTTRVSGAAPGGIVVGVPSQNKDGINFLALGLNVNVGGGSRNVEPLYWLNPLDYSYGELSTPRHMVLPEPILPDADGDGIADQFDKCPGTPAGIAVDSHGCPMDTDGDGVPDDRDKQLITPTECQPVDADGVGKCPCNCPNGVAASPCSIGAGSIMFPAGSSKITPAMQGQLANLAAQMQAGPNCKVVVTANGGKSKMEQQRSWERVNAVIEYMSEKNNIDRSRFIFQYDSASTPDNTVMYRSANSGEEGPSTVPPPHPDLHR